MKNTKITISILLAVLLSLLVLCACSKKEEKEPAALPPSTDTQEGLMNKLREDTEAEYFWGYDYPDSYLYAFPQTWIDGYSKSLGISVEALEGEVAKAFEEEKTSTRQIYGCENYFVDWSCVDQTPVEGDDLEALKQKLSKNCFIDAATVSSAVSAHYSVTYFKDEEMTDSCYSFMEEITLVRLVLEDEADTGWYVSPEYFVLY